MHSKWLGRVGLTALVLGVTASSGLVGCAAERDPINRVQANAMPKSFFIGEKFQDTSDDPEFYARSMIVDVPYGESGADWGFFTNSINVLSKIKWSIEETRLVGRISFERIEGTDGKGLPPKKDPERDPSKPLAQNDGIVVYAFNIMSQFDIRRSYNAQTGEESNVIEENASDRPWFDREYIRVDFSQNLVTTAYEFDTMSLLGIYGAVKYSPMAFDVRNPNDENAPVYVDDPNDPNDGYLDVTNKVFAEPGMLDVWGMKYPACLLPNLIRGGSQPVGNCNPNEITVRHSFKRVVPNDYEPIDWDGQRFETYGAFFTERQNYARDYGIADAGWKRYISRYNIWERHHYYKDPEKMEGAISCTEDNQCADVPGTVQGSSHCDKHNNKCTLPYAQRKSKPIVWHYADKSAPEYFDVTREAGEEWDAAMRTAIQSAKYAECQRFTPDQDCAAAFPGILQGNYADEEDAIYLVKEVNECRRAARNAGKDAKTCDALADEIGSARKYSPQVIELAKLKEEVILCHSPVTEEDEKYVDDKGNKLCGTKGEVARLGDIRYHLVTAVAAPQTNSPWGIMSDSNDPLTGEHVSASINIWTHVNDLFSRGLIDTFRYIGGELKVEDITDGKYVNQWVEAARNSTGTGLTPLMTGEEVDKRIAAVTGTTVEKLRAVQKRFPAQRGNALGAQKSPLHQAFINNLRRVEHTQSALGAESVNAPVYEARRNMLKGSPVEAQLITPAMQQLARSTYGQMALDNNTKTAATSVLQGLFPAQRRELENQVELALAKRGACVMHNEALAPLGYAALSDLMQEKFGKFSEKDDTATQTARADRMKDWLRRRAHYSVIAHEMGHSFGLRHNFVSSSDAWNFRPQYWALRTDAKRLSKADGSTECDPVQGGGDGKNCVGPRWLDKVTPNENKNLIHLWSHSSTMEYAGEPAQDLLGLGTYDFGAARMFYGETVSVYNDNRFKAGQANGAVAMAHQNDFGGLLGFRYGSFSAPIHYSHLDNQLNLIEKCDTSVDPNAFRPANWDDEKNGLWSPVIDGHIVTNESGKWTRCSQPKVDFVQWSAMADKTADSGAKTHAVANVNYAKDKVRVPHGFASDEWADLGNVTVFRHDNGADLYELMHFWIAQQEMNHIFTNYRRGRRDFSVWGAFNRTLSRYHEKMRDAAKGIGLYVNLAKDTSTLYNSGDDPAAFAADILKQIATDNTVAASIAFDHFTHVFSRPQPGDHGVVGVEDVENGLKVARSFDGTAFANTGLGGNGVADFAIANGVSGGFGTISLAGRPMENALAENMGRDYDRDYTMNVGSYYEKAFTAYLFAESADNFISASRDDFVDPRFRSVSLADVFPDGYRRWLANNLTNDEVIKGVYLRGTGGGAGPQPPALENGYALIGNTSWWPQGTTETCFPSEDRIYCRSNPFEPAQNVPAASNTIVDPQIGWEQQKFAIVLSLIYIPDNQKRQWVDQMRIYDVTLEGDPGFENRIEFHDPSGKTYVAQTFGKETLFGKTVEKGVAARILEYANQLLVKGVQTDPIVVGTAPNTRTIGYKPRLDVNGQPVYLRGGVDVVPSCENSRECTKMKNYVSLPEYMRQTMSWLGYIPGSGLKGVY